MNPITLKPFNSASSIKKHDLEVDKEKGGVSCKNQSEEGFFKVLTAFSKKLSAKILKGKFNFSTMQRPTLLSVPESHVQLVVDEFCLAVRYFKAASEETNPLERLKLITAGIVGNFTHNLYRLKGKGPLNPLVGETYAVSLKGPNRQRLPSLCRTSIARAFHDFYEHNWAGQLLQFILLHQGDVNSSKCNSA